MRNILLVLGALLLFFSIGRANSLPTHTVKAGDTLYDICRDYGISWKELADLNKIKDPTTMQVGTQLRLPAHAQVRTLRSDETIVNITAKEKELLIRLVSAEASLSVLRPAGLNVFRKAFQVFHGFNLHARLVDGFLNIPREGRKIPLHFFGIRFKHDVIAPFCVCFLKGVDEILDTFQLLHQRDPNDLRQRLVQFIVTVPGRDDPVVAVFF